MFSRESVHTTYNLYFLTCIVCTCIMHIHVLTFTHIHTVVSEYQSLMPRTENTKLSQHAGDPRSCEGRHSGNNAQNFIINLRLPSTTIGLTFQIVVQDVCATNWIIASSTDKGYNIFANTGRWIRYTMSFGLVPVAGFSISCTKCEEADEDLQCSRSGTCISDRCACTEGSGFGPICAWAPPCHKVDVQFAKGMWYTEFVKNGPNNLTRVQGAYDIVTLPRCLG
jgi:hypothetical protein